MSSGRPRGLPAQLPAVLGTLRGLVEPLPGLGDRLAPATAPDAAAGKRQQADAQGEYGTSGQMLRVRTGIAVRYSK